MNSLLKEVEKICLEEGLDFKEFLSKIGIKNGPGGPSKGDKLGELQQ